MKINTETYMVIFDKKTKDQLIPPKEVAALLSLSEKNATRYLEEDIPAVRMDRSYISSIEGLRWYVIQHANKALLTYLRCYGIDVDSYLNSPPPIIKV